MKRLLLILSTTAFIIGCGEAPQRQEVASPEVSSQVEAALTESERLTRWFDERYEERLQLSPIQMTMQGRKDRYDELDDISEEAQEEMLAWLERTAVELQANFDYTQLNEEAQTSYDLWLYNVDRAQRSAEYRDFGYVLHQMSSQHANLAQFIIGFHNVESEDDLQAYITRLEVMGDRLNTMTEMAQSRAEKGIRPPDFAYRGAIQQARNLVTGAPFEETSTRSPMYQDAYSKINKLHDSDVISYDQMDSYMAQARSALLNHVGPAYQDMIAWLEADMEHAQQNPTGVARHEGGQDFYQHMLWFHTTTDLTAEEIHRIGLNEVARIQDEMRTIMERVEFTGTLEEFFEFVLEDEQFYYPNTDEGRQAYLDDSKAFLDGINDKLPEFFGILPQADLVVRRVEPFREQDGAPQHYYPGTPDGSRPGIYYAHLSDMRSMPKIDMEAVAYHEGNPGHHMQISIAQELEGIPRFRTQERHTVYVEGWALYSELLAKEMGGYEDDYSDFGRLIAEIWRAARLVVDTGMHSLGWTEQDAIDYFKANTPITEGSIVAEVQRYLVWPGQATAYKIGMMRIQELRAEAEQELGELFDIRAFHDTILGGGSLPLPLLEARVRNWIERVQTGVEGS
ncbi:DUF885 domain-containing protein [Aliidiomarina halalkaliphila]|uniref:DUF885 domain-containing protein n=1 Tax=Aliidiomarina halalkaliphila TaxID=2593535 RepID=A0A552WZ14_9GAMM|nr:DUF885 domain-containing protein [Aliidiomarina halalkaliphila]TRW47916.1 DUF885 domain-containing protein [Aliidiomarina halalkaliphila]